MACMFAYLCMPTNPLAITDTGDGSSYYLPVDGNNSASRIRDVPASSTLSLTTENYKGVIGDKVWNDLNGNGIQDTGEPGLKGVKVELTRHNGHSWTAYTDADGNYLFTELVPGNYVVKFKTPEYYFASPPNRGSNNQHDSDAINGEVSLYLGAHEIANNIDAGFIDDIDDDNDGIIDRVESKGYDALKDCDGDCIPNYKDPTPGCATPAGNDIYGKPNKHLVWKDCATTTCPAGDGINDFFDTDLDGTLDQLDLDSDNDGMLDLYESNDAAATDSNRDGMADGGDDDCDGLKNSADKTPTVFGGPGLLPRDLDRDGIPDYLDLDSDGDGVSGITEATGEWDNDGVAGTLDSDNDGVYELYDQVWGCGAKGLRPLDFDNDTRTNPYDTDSDNDGITDNAEAQPTCSHKIPTGIDADHDGLDDAYDLRVSTCTRRAAGITPFDKDGDGMPDMFDLDTDNDGAPDVNEGSAKAGNFITRHGDADGDGLKDEFDIYNLQQAGEHYWRNVTHSELGSNGSWDGPVPAGSNAVLKQMALGNCTTGTDRDWRSVTILPVKFLAVNGRLENEFALITWQVANESRGDRYIVERSMDAVNFTPVGIVEARENAGGIAAYSYRDDISGLAAAKVYYRINQVNTEGTGTISSVVMVKLDHPGAAALLVYPNPAKEYVFIKLPGERGGKYTIRIMDMAGSVVANLATALQSGAEIRVPLQGLTPGIYTLQLSGDETTHYKKLVIN